MSDDSDKTILEGTSDDPTGSTFKPGDKVGGNYVIERLLGAGAMGQVFMGRQTFLNQPCAIKVLPPEASGDAEKSRQFTVEGQALAKLDHSCVVRVLNAGIDEGRHYLVMEFVGGGDLEGYLRERGGKLSEAEARDVLGQILEGLAYAHQQGIVHRDLKPANILRTSDGRFKISDFGLALVMGHDFVQDIVRKSQVIRGDTDGTLVMDAPAAGADATIVEGAAQNTDATLVEGAAPAAAGRLASARSKVGTYDYMSPEVRAGEPADPRSDIYAIGVLAYLFLTGRRPMGRAKAVSKVSPGIAPAWDEWVDKCLEFDPADRFASAREALDALRAMNPAPTVQAPTFVPPSRGTMPTTEAPANPARPATANPGGTATNKGKGLLVAALILILLLAATVVAVISMMGGGPDDTATKPSPTPPTKEAPAATIATAPEPAPAKPATTPTDAPPASERPSPAVTTTAAQPPSQQAALPSTLTATTQPPPSPRPQAQPSAPRPTEPSATSSTSPAAPTRPPLQDTSSATRGEVSESAPAAPSTQQTPATAPSSASSPPQAPEAAPAPTTGAMRLVISPDVAGWTVARTGQAGSPTKGNGPALLENLAPGDYSVSATLEGFSPQTADVTIRAGRTARVDVFFPGAPVSILSEPAGAEVADASGKRIGTTPLSMHFMPEGSYSYLVTLPGHAPARLSGEVVEGTPLVLRATLAPLTIPEPGSPAAIPLPGGAMLSLEWLNPGTFRMGSEEGEGGRESGEKARQVRISAGFWMGRTEVTQAQWQALMGTNPAAFKSVGPDAPVERVSWDDAQEYCRRLTEHAAKAGMLPRGYRFALPTEAQWEYAARAGSGEAFSGPLRDMGWFAGNSNRSTQPAGTKSANVWGLFDMHGNVAEWCQDWFAPYGAPTADPKGPAEGRFRVIRGGSWQEGMTKCRSASRNSALPSDRLNSVGLRVVLVRGS